MLDKLFITITKDNLGTKETIKMEMINKEIFRTKGDFKMKKMIKIEGNLATLIEISKI